MTRRDEINREVELFRFFYMRSAYENVIDAMREYIKQHERFK